jgi:plastocyanin
VLERARAAGVIGLMALVAAACSGAPPPPGGGGQPPAGTAPLPSGSADGGPPDGPPLAGFAPHAPCLEADRYVSGPAAVTISGLTYQPACLRVPRGASVIIEASAIHPLEPGPGGAPGSPIPQQNSAVTVTFGQAGFFPYFCPEHSDQNMRGVIWVTEP